MNAAIIAGAIALYLILIGVSKEILDSRLQPRAAALGAVLWPLTWALLAGLALVALLVAGLQALAVAMRGRR